MTKYSDRYMAKLVVAFRQAAYFLLDKMRNDGWHWSSNYLREHVRCATGLKFTNSVSPEILRALRRSDPELKPYIEIGVLKDE